LSSAVFPPLIEGLPVLQPPLGSVFGTLGAPCGRFILAIIRDRPRCLAFCPAKLLTLSSAWQVSIRHRSPSFRATCENQVDTHRTCRFADNDEVDLRTSQMRGTNSFIALIPWLHTAASGKRFEFATRPSSRAIVRATHISSSGRNQAYRSRCWLGVDICPPPLA